LKTTAGQRGRILRRREYYCRIHCTGRIKKFRFFHYARFDTTSYSNAFRNSTPTNCNSPPAFSCRRIRAWMGGVSGGTREYVAAAGDGAGIVNWTTVSTASARVLAKNAPVALMSNVFVRSRKTDPPASTPLTNMGTCSLILGERRRSAGLKRIPSLHNPTEINFPSRSTDGLVPKLGAYFMPQSAKGASRSQHHTNKALIINSCVVERYFTPAILPFGLVLFSYCAN
jgi:hypothetical protein